MSATKLKVFPPHTPPFQKLASPGMNFSFSENSEFGGF